MKRTLLTGIALLALLAPRLAGAASFTWSSASDALSLDPQSANDVVSASVQGAAYEPLVGFSPDLAPEPVLATHWDRVADDRWRFSCARACISRMAAR